MTFVNAFENVHRRSGVSFSTLFVSLLLSSILITRTHLRRATNDVVDDYNQCGPSVIDGW